MSWPVLPEPTAADSQDGGGEALWEGTAEQGLAMMLAAPALSPGLAAMREKFLAGTPAHLEVLERAAQQARQPWARPYLEQARRMVAWVRDAGADDPALYKVCLREGRPWRSIGDAGLLAAVERCHVALTAAGRLLACWGGMVLYALYLAAWLLSCPLPQAEPVELRKRSPEVDRGPPTRRLAFTGHINRALP